MSYFEKNERQRKEQAEYYAEKLNKRLKYAALSSISVSIILMVIMTFGLDYISGTILLIMRGCAGLFAIVFVVLVAILVYRVNTVYLKDSVGNK